MRVNAVAVAVCCDSVAVAVLIPWHHWRPISSHLLQRLAFRVCFCVRRFVPEALGGDRRSSLLRSSTSASRSTDGTVPIPCARPGESKADFMARLQSAREQRRPHRPRAATSTFRSERAGTVRRRRFSAAAMQASQASDSPMPAAGDDGGGEAPGPLAEGARRLSSFLANAVLGMSPGYVPAGVVGGLWLCRIGCVVDCRADELCLRGVVPWGVWIMW